MAVSMNSENQAREDQLNAIVADVTAIRASILGITAKLDTAVGALNAAGTNLATAAGTNFAALWNPAALTATAGT